MVIQHNISALNSWRNTKINSNGISKNLEKLSSGFRINRAADDAAGLAISEKMRGQILGTMMGTQNVNMGINLIQTTEGGLNEVHSILQRMRELAVQSANGTYQNEDRAQIDKEFQALKSEIDRIAESTHYNGIDLLNVLPEGQIVEPGYWKDIPGYMSTTVVPGQYPTIVYQVYESNSTLSNYESLLSNIDFLTTYQTDFTYFDGANITDISFNLEGYIIAQDSTATIAWGNFDPLTDDFRDLSFADFVKNELFNPSTSADFDAKAQYFAERTASALEAGFRDATGDNTLEMAGEFDDSTGKIKFWIEPLSPADPSDAKAFNSYNCAGYGRTFNEFTHMFIHNSCSPDPGSKIEVPVRGPDQIVEVWIPATQEWIPPVESSGSLWIQSGANSGEGMYVKLCDARSPALGIDKSAVDFRESANEAISLIDNATNIVSSYRASFGASQNRLESAARSNGIKAENLQAAESSIRDVDMAKEMMEFTKNNILVQAAQSMLAQSNQLPQGVLSLLR